MKGGFNPRTIQDAYEEIAEEYTAKFGNRLNELDLDRSLLDAVARHAQAAGRPVVDVGCGPGEVASYLGSHGVAAIGVDFTARMLTAARGRDPSLRLAVGDLRRLPLRSGSCAGIAAFYVLHHIPHDQLGPTVRELRRVLAAGGQLLLATHAGKGQFQAKDHDITGTLFTGDELRDTLSDESFAVKRIHLRGPLPQERHGDKLYVLAEATP